MVAMVGHHRVRGILSCLVVILLFLVPPISAQEGELYVLDVEPPADGEPIQPINGTGRAIYNVTLACAESGVIPPPNVVTVQHEAIAADAEWTTVTWAPASFHAQIGPSDCIEDKATEWQVEVQYTFDRDAPAYAPTTIILSAVAHDKNVSATHNASVGFYEDHQVGFPETTWRAGEGEMFPIPIKVENFGNGAITLHPKNSEETSDHLMVAAVPPVIVPAGDTTEITVDVRTPRVTGYENRQDDLVMSIGGHATRNPERALQAVEIAAVVQTKSGSGDGAPVDDIAELSTSGAGLSSLVLVAFLALGRRHVTRRP